MAEIRTGSGQVAMLPEGRLRTCGRGRPGRRGRSCRRSARRRSRRRRPSGVVPSGSFWTRPWSHHSQMKPPWRPGVDSIASQYSARVPLLLPIAWEYSHMIRGWRWVPFVAWATIAGDRRIHRAGDVAGGLGSSPSRTGSRPRSGAAGSGRSGAASRRPRRGWRRSPDSLPSDQRMTDGWFLSRIAIRATRSTQAPR